MVEIIKTLSWISFAAAAVCLLLAVFVWFRFQIMSLINDLTGKTAKKAIEQIRSKNVKSGDKSYRSSPVNINRGPLTEPVTNAAPVKTEKLSGDLETTLLREDNKTVILNADGTTVLNHGSEQAAAVPNRPEVEVQMIEQVVFIHTNEVIS